MKLEIANECVVRVELSRRNLLSLLAMLDGFGDADCAISKIEDGKVVTIKAVENEEAYPDGRYGQMHPAVEGYVAFHT